jgi:hypothetical protein
MRQFAAALSPSRNCFNEVSAMMSGTTLIRLTATIFAVSIHLQPLLGAPPADLAKARRDKAARVYELMVESIKRALNNNLVFFRIGGFDHNRRVLSPPQG